MTLENALDLLDSVRQHALQSDLSLATRQLLDLLEDTSTTGPLYNRALLLRANYNKVALYPENEQEAERESVMQAFIKLLDEVARQWKAEIDPFEKAESQSREKREKKVIFEGRNISKTYKKMGFRLGPLDIRLREGEITGVVGENGNGKTTLLRVIAGELLADEPEALTFPGIPSHKNWYEVKQHIAFIPQRVISWPGNLRDMLHFSATMHGLKGKANEQRVEFIIHRLGLTRYEDADWSSISSGYKLRAALAQALVWRPRLLILDEPLANLDLNAKLLFMQDLKLLARSEKYPVSVILSSQQLHEIESVVDEIYFLREGSCLYGGEMKAFGKERQHNSFELAGEFTRSDLYELLAEEMPSVKIEDNGQAFMLDIPRDVEPNAVLRKILERHRVAYFRDISQSTRRLFQR